MADPFSLNTYDYDLPEALIAQHPASPRDSSRLLVIDRKKASWQHRRFTDLPEYFGAQDILVANNTRVIKARLLGHRLRQEAGAWVKGGQIEFVLLEKLGPLVWEGLCKASAKYLPGLKFEVPTPDGRGLRATLIHGSKEMPHGTVVAEFDRDPVESGAGELPLPHYIQRGPDAPIGAEDEESYQTLFAKNAGSAAAPTAGLHFTPAVLERLKKQGAAWEEVTLDVGLGTFRPVKTEDIRQHLMHDERYEISHETADHVNLAKKSGKTVTAVGTTSVRTLESAWNAQSGAVDEGPGRTSIFIYPGGRSFHVVDRLLTNFHLPKSTLLMLVCAFASRELILAAYQEAVREKYRFFSYGDAMLVL
jgi:S-adenosylmethionine:tRNA ribosyltransferase-isomerase